MKEKISIMPQEEISDGIKSLEEIFDSPQHLIHHIIKNCLFFHPDLVKERFIEIRDQLNIIKDDVSIDTRKSLPVRKSKKKRKYSSIDSFDIESNFDRKKGPYKIRIPTHKNTNLQCLVTLDTNGNYEVNKLIKEKTGIQTTGERRNLNNYIISHIWANTWDPRYFTNFWNIVLVPFYANPLLDKNYDKIQDHTGAKLLVTIKSVIAELYFKNIPWDELYMNRPNDFQPINLDNYDITLIKKTIDGGVILEEREKIEEMIQSPINKEINMEEDIKIRELLKTIGMKSFVDLFPIISKNPTVSVLELTNLFPEFSRYTANSQSTKLSNAKSIFKNEWEIEALKIIVDSYKVGPVLRLKAKELLAEFNCNKSI